MQTLLEENGIFRVTVPNNCNDLFQPLDLSVNKPLRISLGEGFQSGTVRLTKRLESAVFHILVNISAILHSIHSI